MVRNVVLSLDHAFAVRERDYGLDIWMVRSEKNLALASLMRRGGRFNSVTVFNDSGDSVQNILSMLPTIYEHHPQTVLIFVGGLKKQEIGHALHSLPSPWTGKIEEGELLLRRSEDQR